MGARQSQALSFLIHCLNEIILFPSRPSQLAELSHSEFDPELFSHSAIVNFFVTFATKVPQLTICGWHKLCSLVPK